MFGLKKSSSAPPAQNRQPVETDEQMLIEQLKTKAPATASEEEANILLSSSGGGGVGAAGGDANARGAEGATDAAGLSHSSSAARAQRGRRRGPPPLSQQGMERMLQSACNRELLMLAGCRHHMRRAGLMPSRNPDFVPDRILPDPMAEKLMRECRNQAVKLANCAARSACPREAGQMFRACREDREIKRELKEGEDLNEWLDAGYGRSTPECAARARLLDECFVRNSLPTLSRLGKEVGGPDPPPVSPERKRRTADESEAGAGARRRDN